MVIIVIAEILITRLMLLPIENYSLYIYIHIDVYRVLTEKAVKNSRNSNNDNYSQ